MTSPKPIGVLFLQSQEYFGADSAIHSLIVKHLDRSAFEVHVACSAGSRRHPSPASVAFGRAGEAHLRKTNFGPSVFGLSRRQRLRQIVPGAPALWDLPLLAAYCRRNRIQIIHCTEKPRDALYGRILARITGAKLVVHMHVKFHDAITPRAAAGIKAADRVIAISRFVRDSLVSAGVPPERVVVVPNALDPGQWRPSAEWPLHLRQDLGIGQQEIMVLCASRLFAWKGHRELIRAFRLVAEVEPGAKLVVIGEDDPRAHPGGGSFRAELEELVRSLGLDSKVQFLGFRKDVPALMQAADIFAMPSFEEPFGMVFLEAMALERPVVALANGGTLDVVQHGKTGLLSEPGDIGGLADNLLALICDPRLRATLGRQGRQQVDDLFNAKRMAADVADLYREVLGIGE